MFEEQGPLDLFEVNYTVENLKNYHKIKQKIYLDLYETVELNLLLINKSSDKYKVKIDLCDFFEHQEIQMLNFAQNSNKQTLNVCLGKNTSQILRIKIRIVKYSPFYRFPIIYVNGVPYKINKIFHISWLAETDLIGYKNLRNKNRILNKCIGNKKLGFLCVKGCSGTGKSRLLKEVYQLMDGSIYKSFYCDFDKQNISIDSLCQSLFSMFADLPLFKIGKKQISALISKDEDDNALIFAYKILYEDFSYKTYLEKIAKCILEFLRKNKYFIVIENVQRLDAPSIELLQKLVELSSNVECSSSILLSFNENYMHKGTDAYMFEQQLELYSRHKQRFCIINCLGFGEEDAKEFICKCLQIPLEEQKNYIRTVKSILKKVGYNPLDLQNYLMYKYYTYDSQAEDVIYSIPNISFKNFLDNAYDEIGFQNTSIMEMDKHIYDSLDCRNQNAYLFVVTSLAVFKEISKNFFKSHINELERINQLNMYGIVVMDREQGKYRFRHAEYARFYWDKYHLNYINPEDMFLRAKKNLEKPIYYEGLFLIEQELQKPQTEYLKKIEEKIYNNTISSDFLEDIYYRVFDIYGFDNTKNSSEIQHKLKIMHAVCNTSTHILGITKTVKLMEVIFTLISENKYFLQYDIEPIVSIFKEMIRHMLNDGELNKAKKYHKLMKGLQENIPDISKSRYSKELCKLEILIDYKSGKHKQAENLVKDNLDKCVNNKIEKAEWHMYWGLIYYHSSKYKEYSPKIVQNWETAYSFIEPFVEQYDSVSYSIKSVILNILIKKIIICIIEEKEINNNIFDFLKDRLNNTNMPYFEVKIRHLIVLSCLMDTINNDNYQKAIDLALETMDILSTEYGSKSLYATSLFFLAETYKIRKEYSLMYDFFLAFYSIYIQLQQNLQEFNYDEFLLIEMVYSLREHKYDYQQSFNENILNGIAYRPIFEKLRSILEMSDKDFKDYYKKMHKCLCFMIE